MDVRVGLIVAGRYRLLRPLASGGMGALWVAEDVALERQVGLKFITAVSGEDEAIRRFEREARAAARIQGRHVVHTYDFGFDDARPFLVMELLEGETLANLVEREAPLDRWVALEWMEQLGRGLKLVHAAGIVHRDIKPNNVFLAREADERVLKLLDFGIAKRLDTNLADGTNGLVLGSPGYMSPEQARGRAVGFASDLWSVAAIAFELVTGRPVFPSRHAGEFIARLCGSEPIPSASGIVPQLGSAFDAFFERALHRDPAWRFSDVDELVANFGRACHGELPLRRGALALPVPGREVGTRPISTNTDSTVETGVALEPYREGPSRWTLSVVAVASLALLAGAASWLAPPTEKATPASAAAASLTAAIPAARSADPVPEKASVLPPPALAASSPPGAAVSPPKPRRRPTGVESRPPSPPSTGPSKPLHDPFSGLPVKQHAY